MLEKTKFAVKELSKMFTTLKSYEISDPEEGKVIGTVTQKAGWTAVLLSMVLGKDNLSKTVEIRTKPDDALLFTVRRSGIIFKKIEVLDGDGKTVGTYKAKSFSLAGGYDVYDADGKQVCEIKGKLFKADYKFVDPDGSEIGSVSKSLGSMAKELFTGAGTYAVQISPVYLDKSGGPNPTTTILVLGGAIAIDTMFKKEDKAGVAGSSSSSSAEE